MGIFSGLINWTTQTFQPLGVWGLFVLAFMESSFFPIPPDILLIILSLANPENALWFALICTIGSTLGGMFGYGIGYAGEKTILKPFLNKFFGEAKIKKVHNYFEKYEAWAIFIAAFTPIPYKVFTIGAGMFYVNFIKFVIASVIGRGMRFFLVASLIMWFGQPVVTFIDNYFEIITLGFAALLIAGVFIYHKFFKQKHHKASQ